MQMKTEASVDADALADGYSTFGASNGSNSLFRFYSTGDHTDGSDEHHQTDGDSPPRQRPATKHSGACVHCKALKVRCEPLPGQNTCQRCRDGGHECIPRARKKRKPAPTHEDLQMRALQQDTAIQKLLLEYDQLISSNRIRDRVSRGQIEQNATRRIHPQDRFNIMAKGESATEREVLALFSPTSHINAPRLTPPDIVRYCSLTSSDILDLFSLFFDRVNPYFSILDQDYHTPQSLIWTQPFLFTVICSIAARYYGAKPELYTWAHEFARDAAGHALVNGTKSVDTCQAYLLMAVYSPPRKRWEEDRRWILMGVAIRMAQELELNKPSQSYTDREAVNRTRTWLNCFCVDGSHSIQFGKIPMLKLDDPLAKHSKDWYCSSPRNIPFDVHLCAYVQVLVIMAQWRKDTEGNLRQRIREGFDVVSNVIKTEEKLSREMSFWADRYAEQYRYGPRVIAPEICVYRGYTTQLIVAYLRLVVLAVGFQYAARSKGLDRSSDVLNRSVECAKSVIRIVIEHLYPTGNLRYAMEANFVYVSFAAAYLVNLLRPKFLPLIEEELQVEIVRIVSQLIEVLGSKAVALDGTHTPALYSRFLKNLMARHNGRSQSSESRPSPEIPSVKDSPRAAYSWPDVRYSESPPSQEGQESHRSYHDMDMDFSLTHFVRSVTDTPVVPELNFNPSNMPPQWPDSEWQDQAYLATSGWNNQYAVNGNEHWRQ